MTQTFASSIFLLFNFSSIISMLLLIGIILKSPSYLTKWTLFQVCLALLGSSISSILKLLTYGDDYDNLDQALNQPTCIAQHKLSVFFFYPSYLLPSVLTFYLWFGLIKMNPNIEKAYFWALTISIWGFACIYTIIVIIVSGLDDNWGVMVTRFVCEAYDFSSTWYLYWPFQLIVSLLASVSLFFAIRSTVILWKIWSAYNLNNESTEEIQIGDAVRMIIFIYLYSLMLFFHMISEILQQSKSHRMKSYIDHSHYISNFTSSLFGGLVFLIFGTTKSSLSSLTQYLGYKKKSDDDDPLYVFRPSSYHLESIAATDVNTKRMTKDTIESEAVTIEVLVENDRHSSFLEKQKRTKHYSLQKYTKDRRLSDSSSDWSRYSSSSAGSSREHSGSRNSSRRRRHSDTRHDGSQRRRRHHHRQDSNESKNRNNNDISFGNSRRITIGSSDGVSRSNSDTTSDRRRRRKGKRRGRHSDASNLHNRHSDSYASSKRRSSSMVSNNGRSSSLLHIDGIDERLGETNNYANNNSNNNNNNNRSSKSNNNRSSKKNNIRDSTNSTNSVNSYSKQDLQRIWGQV